MVRKNSILICFLFFGIIACTSLNGDSNDNSTTEANNSLSINTTTKEKLEIAIESLKEDNFDFTIINNPEDLIRYTNFYSGLATTMALSEGDTSIEVKKLRGQLKDKLIASQKKNFPKMRKSYVEFMKERLSENNIYLTNTGTTITFTGDYFLLNSNIKETQESVKNILTAIRFKQVNYKWQKDAEHFTYFKLNSLTDNQIIGDGYY